MPIKAVLCIIDLFCVYLRNVKVPTYVPWSRDAMRDFYFVSKDDKYRWLTTLSVLLPAVGSAGEYGFRAPLH